MKKIHIVTFTSCIILSLILASLVGYRILCKFSAISVNELEQIIAKQTDSNVIIKKVAPRWVGVNLALNIEDITLQDKITKLPIFHAVAIESKLNLWQTILNAHPKFSRITILQPNLVIDIAGQKPVTMQDILKSWIVENKNFESAILLTEIKGLQIVDGTLSLPYANQKTISITKINFNTDPAIKRGQKYSGTFNMPAISANSFKIDGEFFGNLAKLSRANIIMRMSGQKVNLAPYADFFAGNLTFLPNEIEQIHSSMVWQRGKLLHLMLDFIGDNIVLSDNNTIEKVKGMADYYAKHKSIKFKLEDLDYVNKNVFAKTVRFNEVSGWLALQQQDEAIKIDCTNVKIILPEITVKANIGAQYKDGKISNVSLHGITDEIQVADARKYIPTKFLPKELSLWLKQSIQQGAILSNSLLYREDKFDWMMNFKDVTLAYQPGWPALTNLAGNLHLNEKQITIVGVSGKMNDIPIGITTAIVEGLNNPKISPLIVEGEVNTTLPQGIEFLLASPLKFIGRTLGIYKPTGDMHLHLHLNIPIADDKIITNIAGKLQIKNATFTDPNFGVTFSETGGEVNFTEHTIGGEKLAMKFLEQPAIANLNFDDRKAKLLELSLITQFNEQQLINMAPALAYAKLSGTSDFQVKIGIPMEASATRQVEISSDLAGISLALPVPLNKNKEDKTKFSVILPSKNSPALQLSYGETLHGMLPLEERKLQIGKLLFGSKHTSEAENTAVFSITGKIPMLNLSEWTQLAANNRDILQFPINLDVRVEKLQIFDNQFDNVILHYNTKEQYVTLQGEKIAGKIQFATKNAPLILNFDKLTVDGIEQIKSKSKALTPANLTNVTFKCANLMMKGSVVGTTQFDLIPKPYGYDITNLYIENEAYKLNGYGKWNMLDKPTTELSGNIQGNNIGRLFEDWGFGRSIKRGAGNITFKLAWNGNPMNYKFMDTVGNIDLNITNGQIRGINQGFGRIIGLLSLDNIQRRLKFDFSDVLSSGFPFDNLQTNFNVNEGSLHTEGIYIDGPSAYIALAGYASLKTKEINFKMGILPKMGASLPLAAAITAGNPAVGAAFWLLGKAAGPKGKPTETPRYGYKVTGTWESPEIKEIKE